MNGWMVSQLSGVWGGLNGIVLNVSQPAKNMVLNNKTIERFMLTS